MGSSLPLRGKNLRREKKAVLLGQGDRRLKKTEADPGRKTAQNPLKKRDRPASLGFHLLGGWFWASFGPRRNSVDTISGASPRAFKSKIGSQNMDMEGARSGDRGTKRTREECGDTNTHLEVTTGEAGRDGQAPAAAD
jgi:hypothetical protein